MRFNLLLIFLILILVSFIITLNIFFQQNYEQEMAEQFNRQQLLIAMAVASSIKGHFEHIEDELQSFAALLASRGLSPATVEEYRMAAPRSSPSRRETPDQRPRTT